MENEFLILLQAKLDEAKSKGLINEEIDKLQNQINKLKLQVKIDPQILSNLAKQLETELSKVAPKEDMETFRKSLKAIQNDINKITSSGKGAASTIQKMNTEQREFNRHSNSMFDSLKRGFSFLGYWTSFAHIMTSAVRGIKSMVSNVRELSDALTNISYTMDVTGSQLKEIGESSLQMAKDLHTSASNVLGAVKLYANAKETADSILAKSEPAVMMANVTGIKGEKSAQMLQSIMNQFDMTQDELMNISDIVQSVSQNVAHDFSDGIIQINEGISTSGEVARAAGMDLAEYASMIGLLVEKTGLQGSQLGNSVKTIITRTTKAGKILGIDEGEISAAEESLRSVGVEVRKTDGEFNDFKDTMKELAGQWDTLSDVEKSNIAFNLAGTRQINVIQTLLRNWSDYESLVNKANNSSGVTLENQETYAESLSGTLGELAAIWENISNDTIDSSFLKGMVDAGIAVSSLVEKMGLLKTVAGLGIVGFFNKGRSNTILPCRGGDTLQQVVKRSKV